MENKLFKSGKDLIAWYVPGREGDRFVLGSYESAKASLGQAYDELKIGREERDAYLNELAALKEMSEICKETDLANVVDKVLELKQGSLVIKKQNLSTLITKKLSPDNSLLENRVNESQENSGFPDWYHENMKLFKNRNSSEDRDSA